MATREIATHPEYDRYMPDWSLVRAAFEGERAIKDAGPEHLPVPDGFARSGGAESSRYASYIARASFPDLVAPTVLGMVGIMGAEAPEVALPPVLEPMAQNADSNGLSLAALKTRLDQEVVITGRVALVADVSVSGQPYLTVYPAECIINWATTVGLDGRAALSLVVLREVVPVSDADPLYVIASVEQWRVYRLDPETGAATVMVLRRDDKGAVYEHEPPRLLLRTGGREALGVLPVRIIGAQDVTPDVDVIPLLGLANLARRIYQQDADYRSALHHTSFPTLVVRGPLEGDDTKPGGDIELGAGAALIFAEPTGDAKYLEFSGQGVGSQRQSIQDDFVQAITIAVQSLQGKGTESGEALGLRMKAKTASLASVTQATAEGIQGCLRILAEWLGSDPAAVEVTASLDFQDGPINPQIVTAVVNAWRDGAVPVELVYEAFRRAKLTDLSDADLNSGNFKAGDASDQPPGLSLVGDDGETEFAFSRNMGN